MISLHISRGIALFVGQPAMRRYAHEVALLLVVSSWNRVSKGVGYLTRYGPLENKALKGRVEKGRAGVLRKGQETPGARRNAKERKPPKGKKKRMDGHRPKRRPQGRD